MPRFAANLSTLYGEFPLLARPLAAAQDGFKALEVQFPYEASIADWRASLTTAGVPLMLCNAPPGIPAAGEFGLAGLPGREDDFRRSMDTALEYATALGPRLMHVMAGMVASDDDRPAQWDVYRQNLAWAAAHAAPHGITLLVEALNARDRPGYLLGRQEDALRLCEEVRAPNLRIQFDLYHCQIAQGDVAEHLQRALPHLGHIQIAGTPLRHEPDDGDLDTAGLLALIDTLGYDGWVGCEYVPRAGTRAGLGWMAAYRQPASR